MISLDLEGVWGLGTIAIHSNRIMNFFLSKNYQPVSWRDSISRPIAPLDQGRITIFFLDHHNSSRQRPILNFAPRGKLWPQGRSCPPWVKFSVHPSILLHCRECSPLRVNEGVNIPPRGQISPLGGRGEVNNGPPELHQPSFQRVKN
jgi:hypothetical protein